MPGEGSPSGPSSGSPPGMANGQASGGAAEPSGQEGNL